MIETLSFEEQQQNLLNLFYEFVFARQKNKLTWIKITNNKVLPIKEEEIKQLVWNNTSYYLGSLRIMKDTWFDSCLFIKPNILTVAELKKFFSEIDQIHSYSLFSICRKDTEFTWNEG